MTTAIHKLVARKSGVLLDVSFGGAPQPRALTLRPDGDIKQSPIALPMCLPQGCVHTAIVTHVLEYLDPRDFFAWFDELHRVMQPNGVAMFSGPYGGDESQGWVSDPTHRIRVTEQSFAWLDPRLPFYEMHGECGRKKPLPWLTVSASRVPGAHGTISYNVAMQASKEAKR